jgi:hypothetical protein
MSLDSYIRQSFKSTFLMLLVSLAFIGVVKQARAETSLPDSSDRSHRHGSAFVDPLGFLLFGPRIGVEAGSGHLTGALVGRWFDAGLLSRAMFPKQNDRFAFSYTVGLRGRYYLREGLDGVHLGLAAEYLRTRIENNVDLVATNSTYVVPYAEVGYRMSFGHFYADVAAALGYAFKASAKVEDVPGGHSASLYSPTNESTVYGSASLDLGVYF